MLVPPQRPDLAAQAVRWLLDHPNRLSSMARRGPERVAQRFSWQQVAEQTEAAYAEMLSSRLRGVRESGGVRDLRRRDALMLAVDTLASRHLVEMTTTLASSGRRPGPVRRVGAPPCRRAHDRRAAADRRQRWQRGEAQHLSAELGRSVPRRAARLLRAGPARRHVLVDRDRQRLRRGSDVRPSGGCPWPTRVGAAAAVHQRAKPQPPGCGGARPSHRHAVLGADRRRCPIRSACCATRSPRSPPG